MAVQGVGPMALTRGRFLGYARRPNPGRGSTYRRGIFVQTTGTSSIYLQQQEFVRYEDFAPWAADWIEERPLSTPQKNDRALRSRVDLNQRN